MPLLTKLSQFDTSLWEKSLEEAYGRRERDRLRLLGRAEAVLPIYFPGKRVKAVYLTGSILRKGQFRDFSDVDIAVEGLEENYFQVLVQLEDLLERQVDLIELASCRLAEAIRQLSG
jgi:predicted nucleotidyltransferase